MSVEAILESIEKLTLLEAAELVKAMEEKFGVSAAAPVAVAAAPAAAAAPAEDADAEVNVILASVPADKKIAVLKEVRAITGLGLKEAKDLVDGAPKAVKEGVRKTKLKLLKNSLKQLVLLLKSSSLTFIVNNKKPEHLFRLFVISF